MFLLYCLTIAILSTPKGINCKLGTLKDEPELQATQFKYSRMSTNFTLTRPINISSSILWVLFYSKMNINFQTDYR